MPELILVQQFSGSVDAVSLASPDGTIWYVGVRDEGVYRVPLVDPRHTKLIVERAGEGAVVGLLERPEGLWVATEQGVRCHNLSTQGSDPPVLRGLDGCTITAFATRMGSSTIAVAAQHDDPFVSVYRDYALHVVATLRSPARSIAVTDDENWLAATLDDETVSIVPLYEPGEFEVGPRLGTYVGVPVDCATLPDGSIALAYRRGEGGSVQIWNPESDETMKLPPAKNEPTLRVAVDPESGLIAGGDNDGRLTVWDLNERNRYSTGRVTGDSGHTGAMFKVSPSLFARGRAVCSLALHPSERTLLGGTACGELLAMHW